KQESFKKKDFEQALKDGFLAIDRAILSDPKYEEEVSGCTASVGIITKDKIYVGNSGDSRSVLGIKGRAKPLSFDHKPQNEGEKARICAAGGFVDFGRVNGNLALSRAIGDFEFKKSADLPPEQQIVTAFPDVTIHEIGEDDEFLVIACDGIWDCQSSQAVVEFVRRGIAAKQELHSICENMMDNCLASNSETGGVGCDNMTMVVVGLLRGKTKEEWYNMIAERVANGDGPCAPPEGPGNRRNRFDDSSDDYDMDMDQRTRMLGRGSNGGRIILLGDGTELLAGADAANDDDGDVDMEDRGDEGESEEEEKDLQEQVKKGQSDAKATTTTGQGESKDGPQAAAAAGKENEPTSTTTKDASSEQGKGSQESGSTAADEPNKAAPSADKTDVKSVAEAQASGKGPLS
ncbi:protein phosphatase, partial [Hortaea werneckii]